MKENSDPSSGESTDDKAKKEYEEEKLSDLEKNPSFYKVKHDGDKNAKHRGTVWKEISEVMGKTTDVCQRKWNAMRDYYIKKKKKGGTGTSAAIKRKLDRLRFSDYSPLVTSKSNKAKNYELEGESTTSSSSAPEYDDGPSTSTGISRSLALKREESANRDKDDKSKEKRNNEMTALDLYFQSIAATVKTFPPEMVFEVKRKINNIMEEAESKAIEEANNIQLIDV